MQLHEATPLHRICFLLKCDSVKQQRPCHHLIPHFISDFRETQCSNRFLFCHFLTGNKLFNLNQDVLYNLPSHLKSVICPNVFTAGISLGVQVHWSPSAVIRKAGDNVQIAE